MNTGRASLINLLAATPSLADVTVMPYTRNLDNIAKDTIMVFLNEITPSQVPAAAYEYSFELYVMTPLVAPGASDDDLDLLVEQVLGALESSVIPNDVTWKKASRATFEEKFPAYIIELTVLMKKD